jgi:hypothetical protein
LEKYFPTRRLSGELRLKEKSLLLHFSRFHFIRTHRHPVSAVPSLCSLIKSVHQIYYENETRDDRAIGKHVAKASEHCLTEATKDIASANLDCSHIVYESLIADPVGTVKKIYQQYAWNFTTEYEEILKNFLKENSLKREQKRKDRNQDVLHSYTPEEFYLTAEELSQGKFAEYCKKYNIPMSKN